MAISQIPTLRIHIWHVRSGHIYPNLPEWFHRFLLWEFIFGRPDLGRSIPTPCVSIDSFTDSYTERSYLAHQVLGDLPSQMAMSQIPTLWAHIWQTRSWQIYPSQVAISQIPTLRTHIWQVRSGHIYPNHQQWFHRFLLWEFIFGRPGLWRSTPLKWQFYRFLLWQLIFGRSGLDISTPITPQWFHRFLLW